MDLFLRLLLCIGLLNLSFCLATGASNSEEKDAEIETLIAKVNPKVFSIWFSFFLITIFKQLLK